MPKIASEASHGCGALNKEFRLLKEGLAGDMALTISPATLSTPHGNVASRVVEVKLVNSKGEVHAWFDGKLTVAVSKSSTGGTASTPSGTPNMVKGVALIPVTIGGTWAQNDTNTLTVSNLTLLGKTITGGTSVQTAT